MERGLPAASGTRTTLQNFLDPMKITDLESNLSGKTSAGDNVSTIKGRDVVWSYRSLNGPDGQPLGFSRSRSVEKREDADFAQTYLPDGRLSNHQYPLL